MKMHGLEQRAAITGGEPAFVGSLPPGEQNFNRKTRNGHLIKTRGESKRRTWTHSYYPAETK